MTTVEAKGGTLLLLVETTERISFFFSLSCSCSIEKEKEKKRKNFFSLPLSCCNAPCPRPPAGAQQPQLLPAGERERANDEERREEEAKGTERRLLSCCPRLQSGDRDSHSHLFPSSLSLSLSPYHLIHQSTHQEDTAGDSFASIDAHHGSRGRSQGRGKVLVVLVVEFAFTVTFIVACQRQRRPRRVRGPRRGGPGLGVAREARDGRLRRRR